MTGDLDDAVARLKALLTEYGRTGDQALADEAISLSGRITQAPGFLGLDPEEEAALWSLGGAARIYRSRLDDHPDDLDEAITWCRRALDAAPGSDPNHSAYASNLATILAERYDRDRNRVDLDEAVALFAWAVPAIAAAGRHAAIARHNQGQALLELYQADHDLAALDGAVDVLREAVADDEEPRPVAGGYLTSLGQALRAKAQAASDPGALDEAVEVLRRAEEWTAGSDDHVAALVSLGNALLDRSEMDREEPDLADSVSYLERALAQVRTGTPRWGRLASNLGNALVAEFRATGRRAALLRAREFFRAAAQTFPGSSPDEQTCLSNLAACLQELYEQTSELSFLDEAIEVFRETVGQPAQAASPERLQNFGVSLLARFKRYQAPADLDQAISQFRTAARVSPASSVSRAAATNSLGNALFLRFDLLGENADMDAAIDAHEEAVRSARENSIDRAMYQANLGVSLMVRGQRTGSAADFDAAVREQESALAAIPADSQEYTRVQAGLADSLAARAALSAGGDDRARAQVAYRAATMTGLERLPEQAIGSAQSWGLWAGDHQAFGEAAEALELGLQALERVFATQLTRSHKEAWLRDAEAISVRAAFALAITGESGEASRAFERGRALLLSEALQRDRADMERLARAGRADLEDRYQAAVARWNQLSRAGADTQAGHTESLRETRAELDAVIAEIRTVGGYERFLLPPTFADVVADAGTSPLVYLGATQWGGLGLIVHPSDASAAVVWLPGLTEEALTGQVQAYRDAYRAYQGGLGAGNGRRRWEAAIDDVTAWAWGAVMAPVLNALGDAARATLVPAGLLGILPLHASWVTDPARPTGRHYALDEITLCYAPNAQALGAARKVCDEIRGEHLVAVDEPALGTAGAGLGLPFSSLEMAAATATFDEHLILSGRDATAGRVLAALSEAQYFHLSCHGRADPAVPLNSALAMAGGEPLTLRDILRQDLRARVGVLSACETAIPGDDLPNEVVSLPAGLIQAGVGTAVASLWSVPSAATALLMFRFYERWRVAGADPAAALRDAQCWLRDTDLGEKLSYLEEIALDDGHPMAGAARDPYDMLYPLAVEPTRRGYENPYHWAAFTCVGV